jgi:hypothetical protein
MNAIAELDINDEVVAKNEVQGILLEMYKAYYTHHRLPSEFKKEKSSDMRYIRIIENALNSRNQSLKKKKEIMDSLRFK